jgi:hypothetical protein
MDKLKAQLAPVLQHSFWIMAGGILIWTVASWWMSTGSLNAQKTARLTEIKTSFDNMDGLKSKQPKHPNASTNTGMDGLIKEYADLVGKGWDLQYKKQVDVLKWPTSFRPEFRARVEKMRPIEIVPPPAVPPVALPPPLVDLLREHREEYRNYIKDELPNLAKKIGAPWKATAQLADSGGASGFAPPSLDVATPGQILDPNTGQPILALDTSVVLWDQANQQEILQTHFGLALKNPLPSTAEILYTQEDFWVLDNIMDIIAATNDKATGRHEAVVKNIYFIRIGRSARGQAGKVQSLTQSLASDAGGPASGSAGEATAPTSAPEGSAAPPGVAADGTTPVGPIDPAEGRYVDDKYEALTAAKLRGALNSTSAEDALLAVAKRMPVRMRLRIDQRKLHILLTACGNSKLPLEVRQVRLNREPAPLNSDLGGSGGYAASPGMGGSGSDSGGSFGGGFGGGSFGASMPGAEGSGGGFGSGGFGGGGAGMPGGLRAGSLTGDASIDPNQIDVELYGIVYIYNPVNNKQLGIEEPAAATPGAETPAPTPTPAPTTTTSAPVPANPALTAAAS